MALSPLIIQGDQQGGEDKMRCGQYPEEQMEDPEFLKSLAYKKLITAVQEEICRLMEKNDVSRIELAKRIGRSKGFVTQMLNSGRNLTLRTITDVLTTLETEVGFMNTEDCKSLDQCGTFILEKVNLLESEQKETTKRIEELLEITESLNRKVEMLVKSTENA